MKPTAISMGPVALHVADLTGMSNFYHTMLGLDVIWSDNESVTLGDGKYPLIVLHAGGHLPAQAQRDAGLYHFAIVFSTQKALAKRVEYIVRNAPHHFSGSADHLVSEAFYFSDPEGNGIELYYDRDRNDWQWVGGQIQMATMYIDPVAYIATHATTDGGEYKTRMGHVHLKVGDIPKAREFYADVLGFDVTAQLPGALFVSVGGYHHHIGLNTWESAGAVKRKQSAGLKSFDIVWTDRADLTHLKQRLRAQAIDFDEEKSVITLHDPWHNRIRIIS